MNHKYETPPTEIAHRNLVADEEEIEGFEDGVASWGDYPLDDLLIRNEHRTINDVINRINGGRYVMDPDFQRDFIWDEKKQSKLIESVIMRIPLPVFYLAEDQEGRMIVVDGLQRLSTFERFVNNQLHLRIPDRNELHGRTFSELSAKLQNRIEDCNLIVYIVDSKAPERAKLDIFKRVNGGVPLTRQQMRNCLFQGKATRFLKNEASSELFLKATGRSLNKKTMRDREFINRFCAFQTIGLEEYRGDMDDFLALCLSKMNKFNESALQQLSTQFRRGLRNNYFLFNEHSFRRFHSLEQPNRSQLNASLWDVMVTELSRYSEEFVKDHGDNLREKVERLLSDDDFVTAITCSTNNTKTVKCRFSMSRQAIREHLVSPLN